MFKENPFLKWFTLNLLVQEIKSNNCLNEIFDACWWMYFTVTILNQINQNIEALKSKSLDKITNSKIQILLLMSKNYV